MLCNRLVQGIQGSVSGKAIPEEHELCNRLGGLYSAQPPHSAAGSSAELPGLRDSIRMHIRAWHLDCHTWLEPSLNNSILAVAAAGNL